MTTMQRLGGWAWDGMEGVMDGILLLLLLRLRDRASMGEG